MHETIARSLRLCPDTIERRRFDRAPARGTATAVVTDEAGQTSIAGVAFMDTSPAGLGVISGAPLPVGSRVRMHFGGQPTAGRQGRVARCVPVTIPSDDPEGAPLTGWHVGIDETRGAMQALPLAG